MIYCLQEPILNLLNITKSIHTTNNNNGNNNNDKGSNSNNNNTPSDSDINAIEIDPFKAYKNLYGREKKSAVVEDVESDPQIQSLLSNSTYYSLPFISL